VNNLKINEAKEKRRKLKEQQMKKYHRKRMNSFEFEVKEEFNDPVNELYKEINVWEPQYEDKFTNMRDGFKTFQKKILSESCANSMASYKFYRNNEVRFQFSFWLMINISLELFFKMNFYKLWQ
jgi:hypothetical protein